MRTPSPRGMTLLEVMLAMSISVVLAVAIYQSIVIQYAQADGGREKAARAQLIRGVIGQIQRDMRNIFTGWQPVSKDAGSTADAANTARNSAKDDDDDDASSTSGSSGSSSSSSSDSSSSTASATTSEYDVPTGGVLGFSDAVTLIVRRTPAGLNFDPGLIQESSPTPTSDLRLVRYWFGAPAADTGDTRTGLIRQEIGYVPDATAGDNAASGAKTEVMAEEVRSVTFRYFDGAGWVTEWSQSSETPPEAVEVVLGVVRPGKIEYLSNPSMVAAAEQDLEYYRIIVASQDKPDPNSTSGDSTSPDSSSTSSGSQSGSGGGQGGGTGTGGGTGQGGGATPPTRGAGGRR